MSKSRATFQTNSETANFYRIIFPRTVLQWNKYAIARERILKKLKIKTAKKVGEWCT